MVRFVFAVSGVLVDFGYCFLRLHDPIFWDSSGGVDIGFGAIQRLGGNGNFWEFCAERKWEFLPLAEWEFRRCLSGNWATPSGKVGKWP